MKNLKKFAILFFVALSGIYFFSCNQKGEQDNTGQFADTVKYFRHILFSETPFDDMKGNYELTAEEAKVVNNYKFRFDDKKRPVSIEYNRGGVLLSYSSLDASKILIQYTDSTETRLYFDKDGNPKEVNGKVFKSVFSRDQSGLRTGLKFYDKDGNPVENRNKIAYYAWSKLPDGMIKENRFNLKNEEVVMNEFCPFYELRFTYNDKGYVTRMANYQADTLYNCTAENCGDIGVSYFLFENSEKGDLLTFSVHNTTGRYSNLYWGWAKFQNKVDSLGYTIERAYWDQDEEYLGGKRVPVYQYKYDKHGARTETAFMDKDRKLINNPENGIAVIEYLFNEQGHPTDTIRYDKNKVKIEKKG